MHVSSSAICSTSNCKEEQLHKISQRPIMDHKSQAQISSTTLLTDNKKNNYETND